MDDKKIDDKKKSIAEIFSEDKDVDVYIQEADGDIYPERVLIVNKGAERLLNYYEDGTCDFDGKKHEEMSELIGEVRSMHLLANIVL